MIRLAGAALARLLVGRPQGQSDSFNPFPGARFRRSGDEAIWRFRDQLLKMGDGHGATDPR
jgi:hypothetical protein